MNKTLTAICPKLPMRDITVGKAFYLNLPGFVELADYGNYLILANDGFEIHFFEFKALDIKSNYGQVYIRTQAIERLYQDFLQKKIAIHPNGNLARKAWGQIEFSVLDPDNNLITYGQSID